LRNIGRGGGVREENNIAPEPEDSEVHCDLPEVS